MTLACDPTDLMQLARVGRQPFELDLDSCGYYLLQVLQFVTKRLNVALDPADQSEAVVQLCIDFARQTLEREIGEVFAVARLG